MKIIPAILLSLTGVYVVLNGILSVVASDAPEVVVAQGSNEQPSLKITSFHYLTPAPQRIAEICGKVEGRFTTAHRVILTIDPNVDPGTYTTFPGPNGAWCVLVHSRTARAEADLWSDTGEITAKASANAQSEPGKR